MDYRRKWTVHVIKHFVLKISWTFFLSNVSINPKIRHTATALYIIYWYTYIISVLIYKVSDSVVWFITWVRESMITGGSLLHAIVSNLCAALILSSKGSYDLTTRSYILDHLAYVRTVVLQILLRNKMQSVTS